MFLWEGLCDYLHPVGGSRNLLALQLAAYKSQTVLWQNLSIRKTSITVDQTLSKLDRGCLPRPISIEAAGMVGQ